ncbi:MAG: type II toxin-antitoxin system PemK/MazF family toxin [Pseudomonadota bacterium]
MRRPTVICEAMEVVVVPFPFVDGPAAKRRPALVLSRAETFGGPSGHSVMAMITSAKNRPWPLDVAISDLDSAGLPTASVVRMKLFTLDHRLVVRTAGRLSGDDAGKVRGALGELLGIR